MNWKELEEAENTCIICLDQIDYKKELVCGLKCSCDITKFDPKYHKECIVEWVQRAGSCPYCRDHAKIRYLQVVGSYYFPESNYDEIFSYDFETLFEFNKNVTYNITFAPLSELIVKSS